MSRASVPLAILALACADGTGPAGGEGVRLAFADGASHSASGQPSFAGGELGPGAFALAFADSVGGLVVTSFEVTDGSVGTLFVLQVAEAAVGSYGPCRPAAECHGRLLEGLDRENLQMPPTYWEMTGGEVIVEEVGDGRISGRLSDLAFEAAEGSATRIVESGAFDLPLLSHAEAIAIMRCFLARVTGGSCEAG